jgi:hypothetical protein
MLGFSGEIAKKEIEKQVVEKGMFLKGLNNLETQKNQRT